MRRLIVLGCGNFGQVAHHFFLHDSDYEVVAFTVERAHLDDGPFMDLPVVAFEEVQDRYAADDHDLFVAVGLREANARRAELVLEAQHKGYHVASYVSSRAMVPPDLSVGPNTWIMEGAHLHPYVTIGQNTIIWSHSTVGFRSCIGDNCWISGGLVGESVTIGDGTFIGLGATIASFATVGKKNVIGAGAVILKDTKDEQVYRGAASKPSRVPSTRFTKFNG